MKRFLALGIRVVLCLAVSGCAGAHKKHVEPIVGPAVAHFDIRNCKPYPPIFRALDCNHVVLVPSTIDAKK